MTCVAINYNNDPLKDKHRKIPKAKGGTYTKENTKIIDPVDHMKIHGNLRIREEDYEELKMYIDDREQLMKVHNKINNQILALKRRTDNLLPSTVEFLTEQITPIKKKLDNRSKDINKWIKIHRNEDPLIDMVLNIKSVGPMTIAYCITYIDLEKAKYASSLWKYAGLHAASHERYKKGETSGGNKKLRCILWNMAESQIKQRGPYREIYDSTKNKLSISKKIVKSRNTKGHLVEIPWKDTKPCHRHGAATRIIMKHFLADYWIMGRKVRGLPTNKLYVEEKLGHENIIRPEERGWKLP